MSRFQRSSNYPGRRECKRNYRNSNRHVHSQRLFRSQYGAFKVQSMEGIRWTVCSLIRWTPWAITPDTGITLCIAWPCNFCFSSLSTSTTTKTSFAVVSSKVEDALCSLWDGFAPVREKLAAKLLAGTTTHGAGFPRLISAIYSQWVFCRRHWCQDQLRSNVLLEFFARGKFVEASG